MVLTCGFGWRFTTFSGAFSRLRFCSTVFMLLFLWCWVVWVCLAGAAVFRRRVAVSAANAAERDPLQRQQPTILFILIPSIWFSFNPLRGR
ncbi:hypothetical protein KCP78_06140 [Salmonella enterica subsp. enterica]|nr:hypothetical protein KCP78_06140 [Salmonella enterica subsp. enterica]